MSLAHPDPPPSDVVAVARARLLARVAASGTLADPGSDEAPAERYEFGEPFASGGLGLLRRAYDRRLARVVAVKELRRSEPDAERRFLLEAAITAQLQHPGIVPVYDIGRFPTGEPYYCMKLVDGRSLEQVIVDARTPHERLALLEHVLAAADAIAYAHRLGVVHRDLKPANILVGPHGETVVIDWGLAKDTSGRLTEARRDSSGRAPGADATLTDVGAIVGTLRYMPPEQARGEAVDPRSDVFSLGAVLFHVIAGRPPHAELDRGGLLRHLVEDRVDDLRSRCPDAPAALAAIAQKAMSPRPCDRYAGAEAFADDLRRFLAGRVVDAHRYPLRDLLLLWLRRHRAASVVAAVALVVLAASSLAFVSELRVERDTASAAQHDAERARAEALRRADAAMLSQARATLTEDLAAAIGLLSQVDLSDSTNLRRARLIALEAEARGAPDRVLRGHARAIERIAPLADGGLASIDVAGEVWRWNVDTGEGTRVADLAAPRGLVLAAADAPVWAALAGSRGYVVRGAEPPEEIDLGPLDLAGPLGQRRVFRWEMSRHGETLAALSTGPHPSGRRSAAAYLWDLIARPAAFRALPFERLSTSALSPDGATVAITGPDRRLALVDGETSTSHPDLRYPRRFSPGGRYLIAELADGSTNVAWSPGDGTIQKIGGRKILGFVGDEHVLLEEENPDKIPLQHQPRLALRSLITGETTWTADFEDTRELARSLYGVDGGFSVAARGERFALHLDGEWQIRSMADGTIERRLATGSHRRGEFLADGRFALARHAELWLWDPPGPPPAEYVAYAVARDGSHAIGHHVREGKLRLLRIADRRELPALCLEGLWPRDLRDGRGLLAVDGRGRVLYAGPDGRACLSERPERAHPVELPAGASAVALLEDGDGFAVGLADGTVLAWDSVTAEPRRWQVQTGVTELAALTGGAAFVVRTRTGAVFAARRGVEAPTPLGVESDERRGLQVAQHPRRSEAALALPGEDALVVYDAEGDFVVRRPLLLSTVPTVAYAATGHRIAVGVAGRSVLVLDGPEDSGREWTLPEEARGLGFLADDELAVVGLHGALFRVDLEIGDVATLRRERSSASFAPLRVVAWPSGEVLVCGGFSFELFPADPVPRDMEDLRAWLVARTRP